MRIATAVFAVVLGIAPVWAQDQSSRPGTVDPIRCWWQSSAGAVSIGEMFTVVLTCAVIETESMQVVADESRLNVASIQVSPFEILGGSHPPDAHRLQRRFFQYHYQLRLISADAIGRDVNVPALQIPYRVHSKVGAAAALEGRDLTYLMPALPIKVLSLVPKEAEDIRDGAETSLGAVESLRFRSSLFQMLSWALGALGVVMVVLALVPLVRGTRKIDAVKSGRVPDRAVAGRVAQELADVQTMVAGGGWTDDAVARALAALRVVAGLALGTAVSEKPMKAGAATPEGRLAVMHGRVRPMHAAVSSPVTATTVAKAGSRLDDSVSMTRRQQFEGLQSALAEMTSALYSRTPIREPLVLDEAVRHGISVAREIESERNWWSLLRQGFGAQGTSWSQR